MKAGLACPGWVAHIPEFPCGRRLKLPSIGWDFAKVVLLSVPLSFSSLLSLAQDASSYSPAFGNSM